jgi:COMPASS component SWD1
MNLSLLDPFQSDFPEVIEEYLEHKITKSIAFNRRGTLLAGDSFHYQMLQTLK